MSLVDFWFDVKNSNIWFDATTDDDALVTKLFEHYEPASKFERMLWHDQIARHIARHYDRPLDSSHVAMARALAEELLTEELLTGSDQVNKITDPTCRVFLLLPYRHTKTKTDCLFARDTVMKWMESPHPAYTRFYKATINDLVKYYEVVAFDEVIEWNPAWSKSLLCPSCQFVAFDETILHVKHEDLKLDFYQKQIAISLSGGVDSMVCLFIAVAIYKYDVIAIHINYGNRETANDETRMVAWYCQKLRVPLYVRYIVEITRTQDYLRDFYEDVTRKIRFSAYKQFGRPVILGHNQTDCEENIIHNIKKWRSLDNLIGMKDVATIDDVVIVRPMLSISKERMYELAKLYNLPYFKNSTPEWSERGITRARILPVLPAQVRTNLLQLSSHISDLNYVLDAYIDTIQITKVNNSYTFTTTLVNAAVYSKIFKKIHIYVSKKALNYMMYKFVNNRTERILLSKEVSIERHSNDHVVYLS